MVCKKKAIDFETIFKYLFNKMITIKDFGKNLKFEESKESKLNNEAEIFINMIDLMDSLLERSFILKEDFNLDISEYESPFLSVFEDLVLLKYGGWKYEIICWYLYTAHVDPLIYEEDGKEPQEIKIDTAHKLWDFINRFEETTK